MEVKRFSNEAGDRTNGYYTRGGERLGFLQRRNTEDGPRYGFGVDNIGDPYRGALDRELNTPIGTIDYGYDGDTIYGGITPNNNAYAALLDRLVGPAPQAQGNPYYIQALANLLSRQR